MQSRRHELLWNERAQNGVSVIVMDPQNGEIMAMVNVPEFNLNDPFTLNTEEDTALLSVKEKAGAAEPDVEESGHQ